MSKFFVYVDLTLEKIPRAFYVGKGNKARVSGKGSYNELWQHIDKKYGHERIVIYETHSEQDALDVEIATITTLKTRSHKTDGHWGANHTDGGEGISGYVYSIEQRQRMSIQRKGKKKPQGFGVKISKAQKGLPHKPTSSETKIKISLATRGRKRSEQTKQRISESKLGSNNPMFGKPGTMLGVTKSEEHKRKHNDAIRGKKARCSKCREFGHRAPKCDKQGDA